MRLYTERDELPLPVRDDLTGFTLRLKPPFDPDTGEVYFTIYVREHEDVSDLVLHFVERAEQRYRVHATALCHNVYRAEPLPLVVDTWLTRLPAGPA